MDEYDVVGLYEHNINSYEKIKEGFKKENYVAIVHATGTGKSYNALQLAYDNKDLKTMYVVPSNSIIEHLNKTISDNEKLNLERDFPNLTFKTYQGLTRLSKEDLAKLDVDLLILDEFHHIGSPVWGSAIKEIVDSHKDMKVLGMTAYTVRDRGTIYERDMIDSSEDELFSNRVVSYYDLCDAFIDGVLPKPVYRSGYVNLEKTLSALEEKLEKKDHNSKVYKEIEPLLTDVKKVISEAINISDIFKKNVKKNGKYIYFCPVVTEKEQNDMETIMEEARTWVKEMGLTDEDYQFYTTTSEMGKLGKQNRDAFYNDVDLDGKSTNGKLRIMFAINQYNEGVHAPGLDGVIMGRDTKSDIVYFEQLGRSLAVRGNTKENFQLLNEKKEDELIKLCEQRDLKIDGITSKKELVELLAAPTIIDLTNNIGFIEELENNLKKRVKEVRKYNQESSKPRLIHFTNATFNIEMLDKNLFEVLRYVNDRLSLSWQDNYDLLMDYYEHNGDCDVPQEFKTINGYDFDENGKKLGLWVMEQRKSFKKGKLSEDHIEKLKEIGFIFDHLDKLWQDNYDLLNVYYEHNNTSNVPQNFKTTNGYEYDEDGKNLGRWVTFQRYALRNGKLSKERIEQLEKVGFILNPKEKFWQDYYDLLKTYYEHNGTSNVPKSFKTSNGYEYDDKGKKLGIWVCSQRNALKNGTLTKKRIEQLEKIEFVLNVNDKKWLDNYEGAKDFYDMNGNLDISYKYKTENGLNVGKWLKDQKRAYIGRTSSILNDQRIALLDNIDIQWFTEEQDFKLQKELIVKDKNDKAKKIELTNRTISLLDKFDSDSMPTKDEVNKTMIDTLNHKGK